MAKTTADGEDYTRAVELIDRMTQEEFERLSRYVSGKRLLKALRAFQAAVAPQVADMSEDEIMALVNEAVRNVRMRGR